MPAPAYRYEIGIEDIEYLRHGDKPFLARIYKPRGKGPFPAVIDIHGGAWSVSDRKLDAPLAEPLARSGVVVASLDFRVPIELSYPGPARRRSGAMRLYIEQALLTLFEKMSLGGDYSHSPPGISPCETYSQELIT